MADDDAPRLPKAAEDLISDFLQVPRDDSPARRRPTQPLSTLMETLLNKYQIGREAPEHTVREHWAEVVGGANAAYSHPLQIDPRGRLLVLTSHAVVRNELFIHRAAIVEKLRKLQGCGHIRELHLRAG
ncbi:DUF721 domain-containing protein [Opitutaceae bacterium EW11]|nr:DUF721 domain-containing protein [Opitutaceae bacterium EW11]